MLEDKDTVMFAGGMANSVDPNQTAPSHQGLHWLPVALNTCDHYATPSAQRGQNVSLVYFQCSTKGSICLPYLLSMLNKGVKMSPLSTLNAQQRGQNVSLIYSQCSAKGSKCLPYLLPVLHKGIKMSPLSTPSAQQRGQNVSRIYSQCSAKGSKCLPYLLSVLNKGVKMSPLSTPSAQQRGQNVSFIYSQCSEITGQHRQVLVMLISPPARAL